MTAADLPEEVLYNILQGLNTRDLVQGQYVCRSWYSAGHKVFLNNIKLKGNLQLERFISAIDYNPNKIYLNAVKSIEINDLNSNRSQVNEEMIKKLFFRFPNLANVKIERGNAIVENLHEEICQDLLHVCPKLDRFEVTSDGYSRMEYYMQLYHLRSLVTKITVGQFNYFNQFGGVIPYITNFPCLREFDGGSCQFANFQLFLPVFEELSNLKVLSLPMVPSEQDFEDVYLATKAEEVRNLVKDRLSKVRRLYLKSSDSFCTNTIRFVKKYFTGLVYFGLTCESNETSTELQNQVYTSDILDLVCSVKDMGLVQLKQVNTDYLPNCVSNTIRSVLQEPCSTVNKIFRLEIQNDRSNSFDLTVRRNTHEQSIHLITNKLDEDIISLFDTQLDNVHEFRLEANQRHFYDSTNTPFDLDFFDAILQNMTSAKVVMLDVDSEYKDTGNIKKRRLYRHVQTLALRAYWNLQLHKLIKRFPNIRTLRLFYHCGTWDINAGTFQLALQGFCLDELVLDVTFAKRATLDRNERYSRDADFFVLHMDVSSTRQHLVYKVALDLRTVTLIDDEGLKGLTCGEDYVQIDLKIKRLKNVTLLLNWGGRLDGYIFFEFFNLGLLHTTFSLE